MFTYIERKLHEAKQRRERQEEYDLRMSNAPDCSHCRGEGETRVRGIRTITGYCVCAYCGGTGKDIEGDTND